MGSLHGDRENFPKNICGVNVDLQARSFSLTKRNRICKGASYKHFYMLRKMNQEPTCLLLFSINREQFMEKGVVDGHLQYHIHKTG